MAIREPPSKASPMPLGELIGSYRLYRQQSGRHPEHTDDGGLLLASQLGLLPDLRYLRDGLRRSLKCIETFGDQMVPYLHGLPRPRLGPEELAFEIEAMLTWIDLQAWPASDRRNRYMARPSAAARHPLDRYSLSVSHHWANLFYALEPSEAVQGTGLGREYEALIAEFSMYVLAAQARIDPASYLSYCANWYNTGKQPTRSPYSNSELASRVASASRAVRRLSLPQYGDLFTELRTNPDAVSLDIRVDRIKPLLLEDGERDALEAIGRFMKGIGPWRRRPHRSSKKNNRTQNPLRSRTVRERYADGYIRIADGACIYTDFETDRGVHFETAVAHPAEPKELAAELLATTAPSAIENDALIFPTHDLEADALAFAGAKLDGQQWIPLDDRAPDGGMDYITVSDSEPDFETVPGVHPGASSRWAADHRRRALMAHRLLPGRLQPGDIAHLLSAMRDADASVEVAAEIVCLHAAIALGRPLEQACSLEIHQTFSHQILDRDRIHCALAERQWAVFAPPPAWDATPVTRCERPHWSQIRLRDRTGFFELLDHLDLAMPGQPLERRLIARRRELATWVGTQLPGIDSPLSGCCTFLFDRLLEVTQGDLGIARLITGRTHAHSESVAHYAHYDAGVVWDAYGKCWSAATSAEHSHRVFGQKVRVSEGDARHGYGARRVPTLSAVKTMICGLRQRIRVAEGGDRHNLYTAYTWLGLVLGTALRPVVEPYLFPLASGVASQQIVTFLDKARTDYHRRINAVPRALATHLERYSHYIRDIDLESASRVEIMRYPFRYRSRETGQYRAFRPSDFETICKPGFDLELYALRRFVRTELVRDPKLTAEDVDAFMGHWFDGLSPHDRLSTYPMVRLQGLAMGAASRLLGAVSFKPLWIDQGRC